MPVLMNILFISIASIFTEIPDHFDHGFRSIIILRITFVPNRNINDGVKVNVIGGYGV